MPLEQKFLQHDDLRSGRRLRLWIGGTLIAWAVMLAAIAITLFAPLGPAADSGKLNEIAPATGAGIDGGDSDSGTR